MVRRTTIAFIAGVAMGVIFMALFDRLQDSEPSPPPSAPSPPLPSEPGLPKANDSDVVDLEAEPPRTRATSHDRRDVDNVPLDFQRRWDETDEDLAAKKKLIDQIVKEQAPYEAYASLVELMSLEARAPVPEEFLFHDVIFFAARQLEGVLSESDHEVFQQALRDMVQHRSANSRHLAWKIARFGAAKAWVLDSEPQVYRAYSNTRDQRLRNEILSNVHLFKDDPEYLIPMVLEEIEESLMRDIHPEPDCPNYPGLHKGLTSFRRMLTSEERLRKNLGGPDGPDPESSVYRRFGNDPTRVPDSRPAILRGMLHLALNPDLTFVEAAALLGWIRRLDPLAIDRFVAFRYRDPRAQERLAKLLRERGQ